ncbi:MAG: hypothetical protein H6821_11740 [Planctomycetaceae bacterium]|nr:hypothetical protein [Planctomycetales bacterium]MCB9874839.1 hypothetical protein [Planctomycetaceae bacterium]
MTGLLVSVRDATEALAALNGGADVIDIKEPRNGSLGPAAVSTWGEVTVAVSDAKPISVALGELLDEATRDLAREAHGMSFAKIGLSGCGNESAWHERWRNAISCLPTGVACAAVIYADHLNANSPHPAAILSQAIEFECEAILFDTYSKARGHLFDHLDERALGSLCSEAKQAGMKVVLAGSLRDDLILRGLELEPDYIAVRGAACRGDRRNAIDQSRVQALADVIHNCSSASC